MPEKTAAQKKAQQKYMEKFVRVEIRMEAEKRATIQAHAEALGQSVNGFINTAIDEKMEKPSVSPVEAIQPPPGAGVVSLPSETIDTAQRAAEAAGEDIPQFVARAVDTQAKRDEVTRKMGEPHGNQ